MGLLTNLYRILLFTFNIICFVIAAALLLLGILIQVNINKITSGMDVLHGVVSSTLIVFGIVGAIMFVIAFLGCFGAITRTYWMLITYGTILIVILVLQVALVLYILVQIGDYSGLKENLYNVLRSLFESDTDLARETIGMIQHNLKCCGVTGPSDWESPPSSCCMAYINNVCTPFQQGCWMELYDVIRHTTHIIGTVVGAFAAVELVGAIMAIYIAHSENKSGEYASIATHAK